MPGKRVVTEEMKQKVISLKNEGKTQEVICKETGLSKGSVHRIVNGYNWAYTDSEWKERHESWPKRRKEQLKKYREENRELLRQKNQKWREANLEIDRQRKRRYKKENPEKVKADSSKRRFMKVNATNLAQTFCEKWKIEQIYKQATELTKKTGIQYHVDHIYPLRGKNSCGLHVARNLQVITAEENLKKANKVPEEIK